MHFLYLYAIEHVRDGRHQVGVYSVNGIEAGTLVLLERTQSWILSVLATRAQSRHDWADRLIAAAQVKTVSGASW